MEMSPTPALALPYCQPLRTLFPHAGHLLHMPSHIYALLGMNDESVRANQGELSHSAEFDPTQRIL